MAHHTQTRRGREEASDDDKIKQQMYSSLKQIFGFDEFREGQEEVISALLRGENALAVFPTGSGKSLCYQLPAALMPTDGLTIVVSPLIALMKDQVDALRSNRNYPIRVDSTGSWQTEPERRQTRQDLLDGTTKLIFIAPEQLTNELTRDLLLKRTCELFVIDESHSIAEWGASFRPSYLRVAKFATEAVKAKRILALTATATQTVAKDILNSFNIPERNHFQTSMLRPNLRIKFHAAHDREGSLNILVDLLKRPTADPGPTIIYATTQKETEALVEVLNKKYGFRQARFYHAGMNADERTKVQDEFMNKNNNTGIVVATIAFGMGIDKSNIRKVIHFNLSKSLEGYSQEIGRAGRDGKPSYCDLILNMDDIGILETFASCDGLSAKNIYNFLKDFFNPEFAAVGRIREMSTYHAARDHDISETTVNMLLAFLDIHHGMYDTLTPMYDEYKMRYLGDNTGASLRTLVPQAIRSLQPPAVAQAIAQNTVYKQSWAYVSAGAAAGALAAATNSRHDMRGNRDKISQGLSDLEGKNVMVQGSGVKLRFLIKKMPQNDAEIRALMNIEYKRSNDRESKDLERIRDVLNLITYNGCYARKLMEYFGETARTATASNAPFTCGVCAHCTANGNESNALPIKIPAHRQNMLAYSNSKETRIARQQVVVPAAKWAEVVKIAQLHPDLKQSPRTLARFAVGGKSPLLTAKRLTSHAHFGLLMGLCPWEAVLKKSEEFCGSKDQDV